MSANDDNSKRNSTDNKATSSQPVAGPSGLNRPLGSIRPLGTTPALGSRAIGNTAAPAGAPSGGPSLTRTGAPKMTFLPAVPVRRRVQQADPQSEPVAGPSTPAEGAGRGGRGRGRGGPGVSRGRGDVEMVASGPFALGPAASGSSESYRKPAGGGSAVGLMGPANMPAGGSGLSQTAAPDIGGRGISKKELEDDEDAVSDEEGAPGKVDMQRVWTLDYNAPVALKSRSEKARVKKEEKRNAKKDAVQGEAMVLDAEDPEGKDMKNALDLSESDDEEEMEDLAEHFTRKNAFRSLEFDESAEPLYFFQFPHPFPSFVPDIDMTTEDPMQVDGVGESKKSGDDDKGKAKSVTWAADVKVKEETEEEGKSKEKAAPRGAEGIAGQLEVYKSGAVKMRFGKDIVLDVTAATHPSFLQQIVHVDLQKQRMSVFGNVERRFIVSPDIDMLLDNLQSAKNSKVSGADAGLAGLERMDES